MDVDQSTITHLWSFLFHVLRKKEIVEGRDIPAPLLHEAFFPRSPRVDQKYLPDPIERYFPQHPRLTAIPLFASFGNFPRLVGKPPPTTPFVYKGCKTCHVKVLYYPHKSTPSSLRIPRSPRLNLVATATHCHALLSQCVYHLW